MFCRMTCSKIFVEAFRMEERSRSSDLAPERA